MLNRFSFLAIFAILFSCEPKTEHRSLEEQRQIDRILAEDRENKMLELFYLYEIRKAEEHNDSEAFRFYVEEYIRVPRLDIPEHLKNEPNYFEGGERIKY